MKNTQFRLYLRTTSAPQAQMKRMQRIIREELTELQRRAIIGVYFQGKSLTQIAEERGVTKSTVSRTLKRAEEKLRRFLKY